MARTVLHPLHLELGARMVPFGGYEMPLLYSDISGEHEAVRTRAGFFDLSHMGRVRMRGPDAGLLASRVQTADAAALPVGRTRYGLVLNERGGIEDDILISREEEGYLLVVNAGNRAHDLELFEAAARGLRATIQDVSEEVAMVAVQGPEAVGILARMGLAAASDIRYYRFAVLPWRGASVLVSRTGYTGEDGFELLISRDWAMDLARTALEAGLPSGLLPCGLGARDTLRLEAGMPLHGHEIGPEVSPLEAGLEFALRPGGGYTGAEALAQERARGPARRLLGLVAEGPHIPRQGHELRLEPRGAVIGRVCSGTHSPTLRKPIATALVAAGAATAPGFLVAVRRHEVPARPVPLPFYRRPVRAAT
jgi:aminomethyltransferase